MKKNQFYLLLFVTALVTLFLSNPKEDEHKAALKSKLKASLHSTLKDKTGIESKATGLSILVGGFFVDQFINNAITRNNYFLFSTTEFTRDGDSKTIGLGILGNVYISSKVEDEMSKQGLGKIR